MERLTTKINEKICLKSNCFDGEYFQKLIEKLSEYEDLEEKGLIKRETDNISIIESEIDGKEILQSILNQIVTMTQSNSYFDVETVLKAYCNKKQMNHEYDGLFWSNEGATWEYKDNIDLVKLVDTYFVAYRKLLFPEIKHNNWRGPKFPCRYDYLLDLDKESQS